MSTERLQKVMAQAGVASRRACEEIIAAGRVQVNGRVVTEMGVKVDPLRDQIAVDGEPLRVPKQAQHTYLMLYKPPGYLSVYDDERGRPGLEAFDKGPQRLFSVGRLDRDSEGLILLTNDGALAQRLSHPSFGHSKTYLVLVDRPPGTDVLARLKRGVDLEDGKTSPSNWQVLDRPPSVQPLPDGGKPEGSWLKVTLWEGRKRQIRRMLAAEGLAVRRLIRIALGPLYLDRKLAQGESRPLTRQERQRLLSPQRKEGKQPRRSRNPKQDGRRPGKPPAGPKPPKKR